MTIRPIIGLKAIHQQYFVSTDGQEIITFRAFERMSKEMQDAGAVARVTMRINGKKKVRIVALEPFFSLWRRNKLCANNKKPEIKGFMGEVLRE
jgi:hypothetical protein